MTRTSLGLVLAGWWDPRTDEERRESMRRTVERAISEGIMAPPRGWPWPTLDEVRAAAEAGQ